MDPQFTAIFFSFLASIPRIAAVFFVLPLFGPKTVRGMVRNQFILVMAMFVYPAVAPADGVIELAPFGGHVLIALKEAAIGVVLGFFLGTIFWIAQNVGYLIDLQTGSQNSTIFDPVTEHEEGPTSSFMLQLVIAMVLAGGGMLIILELVFESYRAWPVFETFPKLPPQFVGVISARADSLFSGTVRFAAPIIILLVLIEVGLGMLNRFAEHVDVYSLAMPIKSIVAFFVLLVFLSFVYDSMMGFLRSDSALLELLKAATQ